jgi:predicted dienelactone hydrolase
MGTFIITLLIFLLNAENLLAQNLLPTTAGIKTVHYLNTKHGRPIIADTYYPIDNSIIGEPAPSIMIQANRAWNAPILNPTTTNYPLIILSDGYGGSKQYLSWFAEALSSKGYIVAAIENFGNSASFDTSHIALQRWLRPQNVTEFPNHFLQDKSWGQVIDQNKIGFAGFSLGGLAGIWLMGGIADKYEKPIVGKSSIYELAIGSTQDDVNGIDYNQAKNSYKDSRIKSAFLMAPAHGFSFSSKGLKNIHAPIFIVVGDKDKIAPKSENAEYHAQNIKNAKLKIFKGNISHLAFRNSIKSDKLKCANHFEFEVNPQVDTQYIHDETAKLAIEFFNETLR